VKLNVNTAVTTLGGEVLQDEQGEITFGRLFVDFLLGVSDRDRNLPGGKKLERARLAEKIHQAAEGTGEVEISVAEAAEIKELVGHIGTPLVVLNVERFIEG
jgi:hypothetical protein